MQLIAARRTLMNPVVLTCMLMLVGLSIFTGYSTASSPSRGIGVVAESAKGAPQNIHLYDYSAALIIGIDRYINLGPGEQLAYAVKDARGMEKVLRDNYRFDEIKTLYNEEATRDKIMAALYSFRALSPDSAVFVYFAGHGITMSGVLAGQDLGFLVPYDGSLSSEEMYKNISMQQIKADVCTAINAKHVYFVLDSCFAGLMLDTRAAVAKPARDLAYLQAITGEQARQVLTAGSKGQTVLDGGPYGHSVFTGRLIQTLENVEDYITAREIGQQIKKLVYGDAAARGHDQRPVDGEIYGTGDFVFVPDLEKRSRELNAEVAFLEAEMARLQQLKQEAEKANDAAKQREIERQELIKEAELRKALIRRQQREAALKRQQQEAVEAEQQAKARAQQEEENEQRLAMLRVQAEKMRRELGSAVSGGATIEAAMAEIKQIKSRMDDIKSSFSRELETQSAAIARFYDQKIASIKAVAPWDREFETESDYKDRVRAAKAQADPLKKEKQQKLAVLENDIASAASAQIDPLQYQIDELTGKQFTLPAAEAVFEFLSYDLNRQKMLGKLICQDKVFYFNATMPPQEAKEYKNQPDLLVPEFKLKATLHGIELDRSRLHGPEKNQSYDTVPCNSLGMEFVYISPGTFMMGSPSNEYGRYPDEIQHRVTLTKGYYLQTTEVTQGQWKAVMGNNPSRFQDCGDNCPVESVSWNDVQEFIRKLNQREGGNVYRLPTEAEWEYAARAGTTTPFAFGDCLSTDQANYRGSKTFSGCSKGQDRNTTLPVGSFAPNAWGLYDMHGNVLEWCADGKRSYVSSAVTDPVGPSDNFVSRVQRGGCWNFGAKYSRSAYRRTAETTFFRKSYYGFRLVRIFGVHIIPGHREK